MNSHPGGASDGVRAFVDELPQPTTMNIKISSRHFASICVLAAFAISALVPARTALSQGNAPKHPLGWITLGTQGGPIPNARRSQPANLLVVRGKPWLVDCGDGVLERLATAGYDLPQVNTVFLSHLHMDHIGGLQGLIGLRWFGAQKKLPVLTIYGPPGTDAVVAGIMRSLKPPVEIGMGVGRPISTPEQMTRVVIIKGGSDLSLDGVRVRAVRNSHFDNPPGHPAHDGSQSLSLRFDYRGYARGYAIGYTGDTGPSDAVTHLEKGVDLLVSEVIDLPPFLALTNASQLSPQSKRDAIQHYQTQHLTPQQAGKIAAQAKVGRLVFTHLSILGTTHSIAPKLIREAHKSFKGDVVVARDLDKF